jgi:hypothetical protein
VIPRSGALAIFVLVAGCGRTEAPAVPPGPKPFVPAPPSGNTLYEPPAPRPVPEGPIRRGPYVQALTSTSAIVCFELAAEGEGSLSCERRMLQSPRGIRHEIAISDLRPGTRYDYTVEPGGVKASFKTPPDADGDLFFVAWGDCRTYYERLRRMSELAAKDLPDFSVHTGDLVDEGTIQSDWDSFFESASPLLRTGAFWPSMGNHEYDAKPYYDLFILPDPERYYTFTAGPAQFFILDADWTGRKDPKQIEWLKAELKKSTARVRFAVLHQPIVSCPCDDFSPELSMYRIFGKILEEGKVSIVFQGHNHNYQRAERNGVVYITTGGGGAPLYPIGTLTPETKFARVVNHYVRVRVSGNQVRLEAVDLTGAVFDKDEIRIGK